uniref:Putative splicing factor 3A subunit 1 n=1 Tax=Lygus hesperus TaxID=30085 RepID=A0A0A9X2D3_LYGHE
MQLIDWQDFSVVATITFSPDEDIRLPEPENDIASIQRAITYRQMHALDTAFTTDSNTKNLENFDIQLATTVLPSTLQQKPQQAIQGSDAQVGISDPGKQGKVETTQTTGTDADADSTKKT